MTSKTTGRFWKLYQELPELVQLLAVKTTGSGATIPVIRRLISKNLLVAAKDFLFAWAIIIGHWDTKLTAVLNGFGSARTRITTNL